MKRSTTMKDLTEDEKMLLDALHSRLFHNLHVTVSDGRIDNIKQEISIKPNPKKKRHATSIK